jgi:hypothetical protein
MTGAFQHTSFDEPHCWDVSSVTAMDYMFIYNQNFNQDISAWDGTRVRDIHVMFQGAYTSSTKTSVHGMFPVLLWWNRCSDKPLYSIRIYAFELARAQNYNLKRTNGYSIGNIFPDNSCPNSGYNPVLKSGTIEDPHIGSFCYACPLLTMTPSSLPP